MQDVETIRALLQVAEYEYETNSYGEVIPARLPLDTIRSLLPKMYPRAIEIIQTIGAGGLLMSPTGADFMNPRFMMICKSIISGVKEYPLRNGFVCLN